MKKIIASSLILLALEASILRVNNNSGIPVENNNLAKPGMVAYAASYSSDITNEPQYSTQNNKTFQYLNLGSTLSSYRGDSIKVGIIDSGINYDHEDFMVNSSSKVKAIPSIMLIKIQVGFTIKPASMDIHISMTL